MKGLLGQPEYATGLLGAATANPNMARQFANARQNMAAPTSVMDERYPAWKKSQDQAEQFLLAADFVSSAIPAAVMAAPYAKKGLLAAGKTVAPQIENYMARTGLLQPATVWHGSPHRFDKFDASKIGTGEGAQAYGHGLYFAESPDVAIQYRETLSSPEIYVKGKQIANDDPMARVALQASEGVNPVNFWGELLNESKAAKKASNPDWRKKMSADMYDARKKIFEAAKKYDPATVQVKTGGALYKVDLPDEAIAKMLDWDKPLSQQAPEVQKALLALNDPVINAWKQNGAWEHAQSGGASAYKHLSKGITKSSTESGRTATASDLLRSQGVPGIRYLDGGSRGTGAGTSNYVVFPGNESLLKILSRE